LAAGSLVALAAAPDAGAATRVGSRAAKVGAKAGSGGVTISGWATFSGAVIANAKDSAKDGAPDHATAEAQGAEIQGSWVAYRPELGDFFISIELTDIPVTGGSLGTPGVPGDPTVIYGMTVTANNKDYEVRIGRGGVNTTDPGNPLDPQFGLFTCGEAPEPCVKQADLRGGYGTTGERMVVALPLSVLHAKPGQRISLHSAYSAVGSFMGGPVVTDQGVTSYIDQVSMSKKATITIPKQLVKVSVHGHTQAASFKDGYFKATFPKSYFHGKTPVITTTCLGTRCVKQTFSVNP